jgi:hypothetical protein
VSYHERCRCCANCAPIVVSSFTSCAPHVLGYEHAYLVYVYACIVAYCTRRLTCQLHAVCTIGRHSKCLREDLSR